MDLDKGALDRHITGNYGENQYSIETPEFSDEELDIVLESLRRTITEIDAISPKASKTHRDIATRINKYLEQMGS